MMTHHVEMRTVTAEGVVKTNEASPASSVLAFRAKLLPSSHVSTGSRSPTAKMLPGVTTSCVHHSGGSRCVSASV